MKLAPESAAYCFSSAGLDRDRDRGSCGLWGKMGGGGGGGWGGGVDGEGVVWGGGVMCGGVLGVG